MIQPKYQVIWAGVAENDLKGIIGYIASENPHNALNILKKIKKRALTLRDLPERGRIVPELQGQGILQYRELVIPPWRLIYRVDEQNVFVLALIDSRRNVEDLLLNRMIQVI